MDALLHAPAALASGILYAEDFDRDAGGHHSGEPEVIEPVYTLADLDRARDAAAIAARAEAMASADLAALQARGAAIAAIGEELRTARAAIADEVADSAGELAHTILSLLSAALPSLMDGTARREVSDLLRRVLPGLYGEKQVTVRLSPHLLDVVERDLAAMDEDGRARIALVPTDALAPGDVRVSWEDGRLVRDTRAVHRAASAIIAAAGMGTEVFDCQ